MCHDEVTSTINTLPPAVRALDAGLRAVDRALFGGQPTLREIKEADDYATGKPLHVNVSRMIVATTKGGHNKTSARAEAENLCEQTGQPVMFIFNGQIEFINPDE